MAASKNRQLEKKFHYYATAKNDWSTNFLRNKKMFYSTTIMLYAIVFVLILGNSAGLIRQCNVIRSELVLEACIQTRKLIFELGMDNFYNVIKEKSREVYLLRWEDVLSIDYNEEEVLD